jgi:hypothetical protein
VSELSEERYRTKVMGSRHGFEPEERNLVAPKMASAGSRRSSRTDRRTLRPSTTSGKVPGRAVVRLGDERPHARDYRPSGGFAVLGLGSRAQARQPRPRAFSASLIREK